MAFGLLIPYHTGMIYNSSRFVIKSATTDRLFDLLSIALHPWRMLALFIIAGAATAFIGRKMDNNTLCRERSRKLLLPLFLGMLFVAIPQNYVHVHASLGIEASFTSVILSSLFIRPIVNGDQAIFLLDMHHLWFLLYLWFYTIILLAVLTKFEPVAEKARRHLRNGFRGPGALLYPIAFLAGARILLFPLFGETRILSTDLYAHTIYMAAFGFGYLSAMETGIWDTMARYRRPALFLAAAALGTNIFEYYVLANVTVGGVNDIVRSIYQWSALVAIFGYARTYVTGPSRVVSYLNPGLLTGYVLHQAATVLFAYWLQTNDLLSIETFLLVNLATLAICIAGYEIKRRIGKMITFSPSDSRPA